MLKSTGQIRIIAGQWRRRRLAVPHKTGLRPTPDRVRETLFNWIGDSIRDSFCLDMFAGTGALGFESASRGAAQVWMLERDVDLCRNLNHQCRVLGAEQVNVVRTDALAWIAGPRESVDLIFLDPPFGVYELSELLHCLEGSTLLKPTTMLYFECALTDLGRGDKANENTLFENFDSWRHRHCARAGRVSYNLFQRSATKDGL